MKEVATKNATMMIGDWLMEEIWWDGTGLEQVGNHMYYLPVGEELMRIYTDKNERVIEIEKV